MTSCCTDIFLALEQLFAAAAPEGTPVKSNRICARQRAQLNTTMQVLELLYGRSDTKASATAVDGLAGLVGNTPLVRIGSLSEATGCEVQHTVLGCQL